MKFYIRYSLFCNILALCGATLSEPFRQFLRETYGKSTEELLSRTDVGEGGSFGGGVRKPENPTQHRPVIIVHGITNNAGTFGRIQQYFLNHEYKHVEVYGTTYGDSGKTNVLFVTMQCHYIKVIRMLIQAVAAYTQREVNILAYSMGSPIARKAILGGACVDTGENLGPPLTPLVHTFIGIAGANFGSFLCVIPFGSCNTNNGMHCTSRYLNDINSKGRYEGQKVYTIYSKNDDKVGYVTCGRVASALPGQDQAFEAVHDIFPHTDYNTSETTALDVEYVNLFYVLNGGELFLVTISIAVFSFCSYIVIEIPILHLNFMRLYKCLYAEFCIFTLARVIKLVAVLVGDINAKVDEVYVFQGPLALLQGGFFGWLQIIRLGFGFCAGCCFFFILIERVLATIMLKNYETWTNNGISAVFIILHNIIAILGAVIFFSEKIAFTVEAVVIVFALVGCAITIFFLRQYNIHQYEKSKLENTIYTLSEKFQISENIRSVAILWRSYLLAVACIIVIVCLFALTSYVENMLSQRLLFFAFNYTIALYIIISPCIFVLSAYTWRRSINAKLFWLKGLMHASKISSEFQRPLVFQRLDHLKTLDGQKMVYPTDEERELYFHQLNQDWNGFKA